VSIRACLLECTAVEGALAVTTTADRRRNAHITVTAVLVLMAILG
jgi:hypothetical protein